MQIVSNLQEMSKSVSGKNKKNVSVCCLLKFYPECLALIYGVKSELQLLDLFVNTFWSDPSLFVSSSLQYRYSIN